MAFQKTITLKNTDIILDDAYCRIKALRFDHPNRVYIEVSCHWPSNHEHIVDTREYNMTVEDFGGKENITAANAYKLLKLEEEWVDAKEE